MKKIFLAAAAACLLAFCAIGCIPNTDSSEDYHQLTQSEKTQIMNSIAGKYSGVLQYYNPKTSKVDSVQTTWTVRTDSTVTLYIPTSCLKVYVDSTVYGEAYHALEKSTDRAMSLITFLPSYVYQNYWEKYWSVGTYELSIYPEEETFSFVSGAHRFTLTFDQNYITFYDKTYTPVFDVEDGEVIGYILVNSLQVDDALIGLNVPFAFYGKKSS